MDDVADSRFPEASRGVLYVVGTPIGNLEDITLRALRTLEEVDLIAAEDTRNTRRLLTRHGINRPLTALHEHNEDRRAAELISKLDQGAAMALVSDAGTPTLSDPGYRLIKDAAAAGIRVVPIPGPSAAVAALSVSGLPTDAFLFLGFPPRKRGKRLTFLHRAAEDKRTLIFYESPKRMADLLADLQEIMGERRAVLAREMTKAYEEFIRGSLNEIALEVKKRRGLKGECTLLVAGGGEALDEDQWPAARRALRQGLASQEQPLAELVRQVADQSGIARNKIYAEALRIKQELES